MSPVTKRPTGMSKSSPVRRFALATGTTAALIVLAAGPAAAHVEVESDNAQALGENVEITFHAESESATAGITQLRVVLPEGIAPADVTYGEGPKGWTFTAEDDGYSVKGPALQAGADAEHSIVVKQLPDAKELAFKTLQSYSDGRIDRWIELGESGGDGHGHGNEAPVLKLKAAAPGAKPASPSPSARETVSPTPTVAATEPSSSPATQATETEEDDGGMSAGVWGGIGAAVLVAAGGAFWLVRRRTGASA